MTMEERIAMMLGQKDFTIIMLQSQIAELNEKISKLEIKSSEDGKVVEMKRQEQP